MGGKIVFITGGARSGKSGFALKKASEAMGRKVFVATAEALDDEMRERIERHRAGRGDTWETIEEPLDLAGVIGKSGAYDSVIIDCLTLWLSNVMHSGLDPAQEIERLVSSMKALTSSPRNTSVFVVSNEVGTGIVPDNKAAREFRDLSGILNQKTAGVSDEAYLVVAGIPVKIKGDGGILC